MKTFDLQHAAMAIPNASPAMKHVLLVLALRADAASRQCRPGIPRIAADTGLSERQVHRVIVELEQGGHISRAIQPGIGTTYTVHPQAAGERPSTPPAEKVDPCQGVTPDVVSPLTQGQATPDMVSSKLPRTTRSSQKTSSSSKVRTRATPFPTDFVPLLSGSTAAVVDGWPPGRLQTEIEAMADWHAKEGKLSKDWQASWRTWVRNSKKWDSRNEQPRTIGRTAPTRGAHASAVFAAFDRVDLERF